MRPDIAAYADRIVTMRDGQIVSDERREAEPPPAASRHRRDRADRCGPKRRTRALPPAHSGRSA